MNSGIDDNDSNGPALYNENRGVRRRFRKTVFVVPSLLTTANIFCGFYSVMESMAGSRDLAMGDISGATSHFDRAAINIGFAVLFDFLDGRIARMTGATTEFGIELDSIADVISFGLAPALLAFSWGYGHWPELHKLAWAASFVYVICGALRLARFNVQTRQPHPNLPPKNPKIDKRAFVGMPIPAGACLIAAIVHFSPRPIAYTGGWSFSFFGRLVSIEPIALAGTFILLVGLLSFLMISTIRYSNLNIGSANYHPRVLILGLSLVVLAIWFYSQWTLLIMATLYTSHGVITKVIAALKPRRASLAEPGELDLESKPQR